MKADAPRHGASAFTSAQAAGTSAGARPPAPRSIPQTGADLPELREHIRARRAALAGFMEQGASLVLAGDVIRVIPRNDIYIRYLNDNRVVIAELASELYGRPLRVEISLDGADSAVIAPATSILAASSDPMSTAEPENDRTSAAMPGRVRDMTQGAANGNEAVDSASAAPASAAANDRQALYADPVVRRIFDEFQARLVDIRERPAAPAASSSAGVAPGGSGASSIQEAAPSLVRRPSQE